ncbi:hypothetical protein GN244_ATG04080 [Phytophthora infestans]|uniref:Uncharacterized protein n=1 Tax=Phytophthora infestans TaxID=4787 RepID=A0A833TNL5_PHYIN|nr:hypothetical protein GN244_ATG04080 [Phytophthora infestans]KAF4137062.1 hypothetical protein GN958_ATG13746 [Phytophthora infestans]
MPEFVSNSRFHQCKTRLILPQDCCNPLELSDLKALAFNTCRYSPPSFTVTCSSTGKFTCPNPTMKTFKSYLA